MFEMGTVGVDAKKILERVRQEIARRRTLERLGLGGNAAPGGALEEAEAYFIVKEEYRVEDFLGYGEEIFLINAYLGLLGREPDDHGYAHYLEKLHTGRQSKVEVLGRLRLAREGRAKGVPVRGLYISLCLALLQKVPVMGRLAGALLSGLETRAFVARMERLEQRTWSHLVEFKTVTEERSAALDRMKDRLLNHSSQMDKIRKAAEETALEVAKILGQLQDHRLAMLDQERRLALLLEEARKRLPEPMDREQIERLVAEEDHLLDAFYHSFEDRFRGTRADIGERVNVYLPHMEALGAGTAAAPILDLGCGRGEWLELCQARGLVATGVDRNPVLANRSRELGLEVAVADAVEYLKSLAPDSLGAVTGFHIIEHLPFKDLIALIDSAFRALKPGGGVIFETPNPENLTVGACTFYLDPTHVRPIPPPTLEFLLKSRGFVQPQRILAPIRQVTITDPELQQFYDRWINVPPDYAILARKS